MKLSIIIPVYNGEATIARCVNSILKQGVSRDRVEVIVVDDCSTDNTVKVVESLQITPPTRSCRANALMLRCLGCMKTRGRVQRAMPV